jgi:hypothetical protein
MITLTEAVASARVNAPDGLEADEAGVRELREGWYFPLRGPEREAGEPLMVGSNGLIINRHTEACLVLGSAFSVERDLEAYDLGFQFSRYDLTITSVADETRAVQALQEIGVSVVTPETAHGVEWRIPRPLTRAELRQRLASLPCTFENVQLYFRVETLLAARASGWFSFELREHPAESASTHA